jgi:hypothetical protein
LGYLAFNQMNNHPLLRNQRHPILRTHRGKSLLVATVLGLGVLVSWASAQAQRVIPTVGLYKASGRTKPANYTVQGQVKRRGGRKVISSQVTDTCHGFATFAPTVISRASGGAPVFSARVGNAAISGRWTSSTRIKGSVHTPCAKAQEYVMKLTG